MVRVRKLALAIAAASALSSGMAHALGLGEVTLQSALNQPLVAEIELLEVRDLATGEVLPTLASPEEFSKAGVDRQYFLTDLKFTPVLKPNGKSVIRVTSSKPMREPYLNFLVEVLWPNGRLLREYTLLLDPPLYSPQSVVPVAQAPAVAPTPVAQAPDRTAAPATSTPPRPTAPAAPRSIEGSEYTTSKNDTLWEIAQQVRGSGSVHQAMLAIQDLNPNAFIDGNINRMKSGQVLRLPDEQQLRSRSQAEAIAQVAEQNNAWREGRSLAASARQLDATKRETAGAAPAQVESRDTLKLVSAESGKATSGSEKGSEDTKALTDKLAVTQESLDSSRRENAELKDRMGDLQSQLDKLQRLIQLKDDQMAKLQADLAAQAKAGEAAAVAEAPEAIETPLVAAEPAAVPAETPAQPVVEAPAVASEEPDFNYSEEPASQAAEPVAQEQVAPAAVKPVVSEAPVTPVKPEAPVKPVSKPAPVQAPVEEPGFVDQMLQNPMMLGAAGGGALLVLLLALMMLSRRNAMKEAELQESLAMAETELASGEALQDDTFEGLGDDLTSADLAASEAQAPITPQTGDALGEADIYIAYGRFNQAAELLENALNQEPHRADLRLKLMEVYAEMGDREGFARQDNELREIGGSAAEVDQLKAKYPSMAAALGGGLAAAAADDTGLDSFSLDDLTLDEPVSPAASETAGDLDDAFDLSLDDFETDQEAPHKSGDSLSLDADLEFDAPAATPAADADDLGFDLSLDEPDAPAAEAEADVLSLDTDLADFSLDLDEPAKAAATPEEDDFLLSLDEDEAPQAVASEVPELSMESLEDDADNAFDLPTDFDLSVSEEEPAAPVADSFAAQLDEVSAELEQLSDNLQQPADLDEAMPELAGASAPAGLEDEDDFDFLSGTDETATKLDLARAYIDMGDAEGARDILDEVVAEGSEAQQQEARELIAKLS